METLVERVLQRNWLLIIICHRRRPNALPENESGINRTGAFMKHIGWKRGSWVPQRNTLNNDRHSKSHVVLH